MSMDGRYSAKSQGWRCGYVHGWTVFREEPGMAVRLCPWMDGQKIAPCIFCTSTIHGGRLKIAPCIFRTPHSDLHGWRKCNRIVGTILAMWVG